MKVLIIILMSSCSLLSSNKYQPSLAGVTEAIDQSIVDLNSCTKDRPSLHEGIDYKLRLSFLIDREGVLDKIAIRSQPQLTMTVRDCLTELLESFRFEETSNGKAIRVYKKLTLGVI